MKHGKVRLDAARHGVWFGDAAITLTALEFEILSALMARPEVVFSREQIMEAAYGAGTYVSDRTIDSHIRNLRAKFGEAGCTSIIDTVHGVGFRLGTAT
jgi:two-component system OmpR family response regulator